LSKVFFCTYGDNWVIFVLDSVYVLYYIYSFAYVEPFLHLWNETNLIMAYGLSNVLLNWVGKYFIEKFFLSMFIKEIGV
jgi:hypothetical protein